MHFNNLKNFKSSKKTDLLNNINDYIIQIDYFDKTGIKKYNNNIPLKYILDQKNLKNLNLAK